MDVRIDAADEVDLGEALGTFTGEPRGELRGVDAMLLDRLPFVVAASSEFTLVWSLAR
jgi:hypothetical protein